MRNRETFHEVLVEALGSNNVYFQPPESVKLKYPCVIYSLSGSNNISANDSKYIKRKRYTVTLVDYDPDSDLADNFEDIPYSSFDRMYAANNLNHFVYTIFY